METSPEVIIGIIGLALAIPAIIAIFVQGFRWWKRLGNRDTPRETDLNTNLAAVLSSTIQPRLESFSFESIRRMEEGRVYFNMTIATSLHAISPIGIAMARELMELENQLHVASRGVEMDLR